MKNIFLQLEWEGRATIVRLLPDDYKSANEDVRLGFKWVAAVP